MASSREASPAVSESGTTSPAQLTPNSKVKALLASFSDDSDDEVVTGLARTRIKSLLRKTSPSKSTIGAANEHITNDAAGSDSEDEEIIRPKGRLAARMKARKAGSDSDSQSINGQAPQRKKLFTRQSSSPKPTNTADEDSEANELPVLSRKRKVRVPRQETPKSSPSKAPASPGLFVSPQARGSAMSRVSSSGSDSDNLPEHPGSDSRFLALVEKKRQELKAKEGEKAQEKAKRAAERKKYAQVLDEEDGMENSDEEAAHRLTQQSRPARKASKKAIEEMNRETQRLIRNQQLAHNAITKKKITKASLFAKFNFRTAKGEINTPEPARPTSSSSAAPHSDVEMKDTPPTSPVSPAQVGKSALPAVATESTHYENKAIDNSLPALEETLSQIHSSPPPRLDNGKGRAIEEHVSEPEIPKERVLTRRLIKDRAPRVADRKISPIDDSESDLEIVSMKPALKQRLDKIFDKIPAKQDGGSRSLHTLRMLAHLTSPSKQNIGRNKKPGMTTSELQLSLQQRARQQATREREERLQALKAKGVIIQTSEERNKEQAELDDMFALARRQDEELAKREKAAAKKERKESGQADPLGDSSDDEDYEAPKNELEEELSVSGSDEGEPSDEDLSGDENAMDVDGDEHEKALNPLFDNEADDTDDDETESDLIEDEMAADADVDEDEEEQIPITRVPRKVRKSNIISDDEDEEEPVTQQNLQTPSVPQFKSPTQQQGESPAVPNSVLRSATKTFIPGVTVAGPAGLGLTQIFAGTMDESQMFNSQDAGSQSQQVETGRDNMDFLRRLPAPTLPPFIPTMEEDTQDMNAMSQSQGTYIPESQPNESMTQGGMQLDFSQSQIHGFDSLVQDSPMSQFPDLTQDVGFAHMTPIKGRFVDVPPSTVETLVLQPNEEPETMQETPIVKKKGKLRRRAPQLAAFSDDEELGEAQAVVSDEDDLDLNSNAFDVMRKAVKKKVIVDEFDKKKSKAKEMVHEQAEESEDEYAGLGGASDDESGGEEDAFVKEMIDDEAGKDVDESKLAAFFADRERANDEKQVEKLYKDITNGMLRRKRGADYDLSDSDDGGEARQRRKRKEFAKMRKALLADERIGKIAENPKRQAFLRAIEDRGSDNEMGFLDDLVERENETDSQSTSQGEGSQQVVPNSQPTDMGPPKRKHPGDAEEGRRAPPHLRRTNPVKRPSNLAEIRESLSSLIEEPNSLVAAIHSGSESEDDLEIEGEEDLGTRKSKDKENRDPFALRRTKVAIIDRISLKRASSSTVSNSTRLAFAAPSATVGFKVPPLLRRATTNNSIASSTSSSVSGGMSATERMAGGSGNDGVKRGGSKSSGINYFARESERRAAVVKTEKRREQKLVKGAQTRRKVVGGLFGGGKFE